MNYLSKYLTRDASLIAIECWYNGRVHYFKEYTGLEFPLNAFRYKNGAFEFFIDLTGFQERLPKDLSRWIIAHEDKFRKVHEHMVKALKYFNAVSIKPDMSVKDALKYFGKVCDLFAEGFIGVLITHHLPLYHEKFKKRGEQIFEEKLVREVIKWREAEGNIFFNEANETVYFLLKEIARSRNWNPENLYFLTFKELSMSINENKPLPREIIERRKNSVYMYFDDRVIYAKEIDEALRKFNCQLNEENLSAKTNKITGVIASKGKARGTAKLIFNRRQLNKFNKGDILVAPMTSPWYVPAMRKASAIITDEGGITCHAAIISRELRKPCIIGTKYATRFLKDGDLVEVDANKGIVKKLE